MAENPFFPTARKLLDVFMRRYGAPTEKPRASADRELRYRYHALRSMGCERVVHQLKDALQTYRDLTEIQSRIADRLRKEP